MVRLASRRLNFAQAFNPMGSLIGRFVAKDLILAKLDPGCRFSAADANWIVAGDGRG